MRLKDLSNLRFGRYLVIERASNRVSPGGSHSTHWWCNCDCGNKVSVNGMSLTKGLSRSCGCLKSELSGKRVALAEPWMISRNMLVRKYIASAKKKGHQFSLTTYELESLFKQNCHYCGCGPKSAINAYLSKNNVLNSRGIKVFEETPAKAWYYYNGVDRKNNEIGYSLENCVPCCAICNFMKSDTSYTEFTSYLDRLAKFQYTLGTYLLNL